MIFPSSKRIDDCYPLAAQMSTFLELSAGSSFVIPSSLSTQNLWGQLELTQTGREPCVDVMLGKQCVSRQFFRPHVTGRRLLNLSQLNLPDRAELALHPVDCRIQPHIELLSFAEADLDGPVLILAPHPDDAELAAFGVYRQYAAQTWIVTLSAGEHLQRLNRQYIPRLDQNIAQAELRKGVIRSWNSVTTPLLAGIPQSRLVMLGYFNMTLAALMQEPELIVPFPRPTSVSPAVFRAFNSVPLPSDGKVANRGVDLIQDLVALIDQIKPRTILVTHPELDPHSDHQAAAIALGRALQQTLHCPEHILLYVNHFKDVKRFPFGPEHANTALPPAQIQTSVFGPWKLYSHPLPLHVQLEKVCALDTMHDLRHEWHLDRRLKVWWQQKWAKFPYRYYGKHPYFQTAIKAQEVFTWLSGQQFMIGMTKFHP
jgi:LmbE family N-acetylglucosaminyl deacetylase